MARPTISDIARRSGVSSTAVSFALNGRPGVADATRERIRAVAREMGWSPSIAARALPTSRVDTVGLLVTASADVLSRDTFYLQLIAGIEKELTGTPVALVLKILGSIEEELEVLRQWHGEARVDGVVLVNPRLADPRGALVAGMEFPAVFIGTPRGGVPCSSVDVDDASAMQGLLEDLRSLGYRSLAYLRTSAVYGHDASRLEVLGDASQQGIEVHEVPPIDAGSASVRAEVDQIIAGFATGRMPEVLVCEDEMLTLAALSSLDDRGLRVPEDVGVVSWEGSPGLISRPPCISTMQRSPVEMGQAAVSVLRELLSGEHPGRTRHREIMPPRLVVRDSLRRSDGRAGRSLSTRPGAARSTALVRPASQEASLEKQGLDEEPPVGPRRPPSPSEETA